VTEVWLLKWFGTTWSIRATAWTLGLLTLAPVAPNTATLVGYRETPGPAPRPAWLRLRPSAAWLTVMLALFVYTLGRVRRAGEFLYFQF
jgi:alginate O-acetyltransferase complex protein AlgI